MSSLRSLILGCSAISIGIISSCVFEDDNAPHPSEVFVKYYGSSGTQEIKDMIVNSAGNVVILGNQTLATTAANQNVLVIEVDTLGNEISSRSLSLDTSTVELAESIKEISSGYLITGSFAELIGGQTQQFGIFWAHLDADLGLVKLDTILQGTDNVTGMDIMMTAADQNVVIVGSTDRKEANDVTSNAGDQFFLIKRDFQADTTIWRKSYGFSNSDEEAIAVFELPSTEIAIIGSATNRLGEGGATGKNVVMMIFNDLATSQVTAPTFGVSIDADNSVDDQPNDVIRTSGGFVVVGTSTQGQNQRPFLMGILESGTLIFNQALESVHANDNISAQGNSVTQTRENDLAVVGTYPSFSITDVTVKPEFRDKNGEVMYMRAGQTGLTKTEYEGNFGLVSGNDVGEVVLTLPDGSILIGATIDFGSNQTMIALMKLNDRGILQEQ